MVAINLDNAPYFVEPILKLSQTDQMKIMSILSPINEKVPEKDLGGLLKEVLCSEGKAIKIESHLNSCNLL